MCRGGDWDRKARCGRGARSRDVVATHGESPTSDSEATSPGEETQENVKTAPRCGATVSPGGVVRLEWLGQIRQAFPPPPAGVDDHAHEDVAVVDPDRDRQRGQFGCAGECVAPELGPLEDVLAAERPGVEQQVVSRPRARCRDVGRLLGQFDMASHDVGEEAIDVVRLAEVCHGALGRGRNTVGDLRLAPGSVISADEDPIAVRADDLPSVVGAVLAADELERPARGVDREASVELGCRRLGVDDEAGRSMLGVSAPNAGSWSRFHQSSNARAPR